MADGAYGFESDMDPVAPDPSTTPTGNADTVKTEDELAREKKQVGHWIKIIQEDRRFHSKAYKRMKTDMFRCSHGYDSKSWNDTLYVANISGRHVKQKTAQLYAKNPRIVAQRRETMDFKVWDEDPETLKNAFQTVDMATKALGAIKQQQSQAPTIDQAGNPLPPPPNPLAMMPPEQLQLLQQAYQTAQSTIQDYTQGMQRRQAIKKLGKTLEILFNNAMRTQRPYDFKKGMKACVRRACTTGVGYVELSFQRDNGPSPVVEANMKDTRTRIDHLKRLMQEASDGEIEAMDIEMAELEDSAKALAAEPQIVLSEGLVFDYPPSTRVIPDRTTTKLDGFIGARHVTIEYMYTCDQVEELFGADLKRGDYKGYSQKSQFDDTDTEDGNYVQDDQGDLFQDEDRKKSKDMVCVWKTYDKLSGLVYYTADGHDQFLRAPAAPDVFVSTFWPLFTLTFNDCENEDELFPLSDVQLIKSQQDAINLSRQGKKEHRKAARPRWASAKGALDEDSIKKLKAAEPFDVMEMNLNGQKIEEILQLVKVPGVDPNLYDTNEVWSDVQTVVGSQQASFGGTSSGDVTATETTFAAGQANAADGASVDELDAFLTQMAQAAGEILLRETSPQKVAEICGPGAYWPALTIDDIMNEVYLEVQAGSMGKPNQALELANFQKLLPFLIQMPGIAPSWMARESVRRLDDNVDLTEALSSGVPSVVAQNALASVAQMSGIGGPPPNGTPPSPAGKANQAAHPAPPPGGTAPMPSAQGSHGAPQGPSGALNGPAAPPIHPPGSTAPMGANNLQ